MKRSILLISALLGAGSMVPGDVALPTVMIASEQNPSGESIVRSVRNAYERGEYSEFLKKLDDDYQTHRDGLDNLIRTRPGAVSLATDGRILELKAERDQELKKAISGSENLVVSEQVESLLRAPFTPHQVDAWNQFNHLRSMAPGSGSSDDENRLIALDLEYEYKTLHLDLLAPAGENRRELSLALEMERLEKLLAMAPTLQGDKWKESILEIGATFDAWHARALDRALLHDLATGKRKPQNEVESQVASILATYEAKRAELYR